MNQDKYTDLETICKRISNDGKDILTWGWDDWFQAVLSKFSVSENDTVLSILEKNFTSCWNNSTIKFAPDYIQATADNIGGIRDGQLLFAPSPHLTPQAFGAWWPWTDRKTMSLRIFPVAENLEDLDRIEFITRFRYWFGF